MFERFTTGARRAVVTAQEEARDRRASAIRTEHLLLGLYSVPDSLALRLLAERGIDRAEIVADVDALGVDLTGEPSAEALATLGIDLDEVRRQAEEAFGPGALERTRAGRRQRERRGGHMAFHATAKKAMELSLREALRLKHGHIGTEHLLLALLHPGMGAGHDVLARRGITLDDMRVAVAGAGAGEASG
ncbi:Clp protease [Pseudonocardia sulfidoxydans NBRC 16205]|uniref:Clp protease n=1 Tax=Pseudonocardia sulfidoxydans NBRC 16205 TaxID=1223511 RepID=A0A511DPB5_9PSEU|nr:Clp protease N-terminal domain-containing protein [Pseudonocardia sulfidoxydans]GEL26660.1 Clp protease [Pseudonocardia sulfidoxydans NBRC 16205]